LQIKNQENGTHKGLDGKIASQLYQTFGKSVWENGDDRTLQLQSVINLQNKCKKMEKFGITLNQLLLFTATTKTALG
jgi:hypothetical protein